MNWHELLIAGGVVALVTGGLKIWVRLNVESPATSRKYECQELVADTELAVTYRDAPMRPCGQTVKLLQVKGDCTPLCPKHNKPMVRVS